MGRSRTSFPFYHIIRECLPTFLTLVCKQTICSLVNEKDRFGSVNVRDYFPRSEITGVGTEVCSLLTLSLRPR